MAFKCRKKLNICIHEFGQIQWLQTQESNTRKWGGVMEMILQLFTSCFFIVVFPSLEQACPPLDLSFWVDSRRNWNPWVTFHLENKKLTRKGFSQLFFASFNRKTSIQTSQCKMCFFKNLHYFRKPRFYFKNDLFTCIKF